MNFQWGQQKNKQTNKKRVPMSSLKRKKKKKKIYVRVPKIKNNKLALKRLE